MKSPPEKKRAALYEQDGPVSKGHTELHYRAIIQPEQRFGLEIFAGADRIRLQQTIDGHTRTISLVTDEAELLADKLPDAIRAATTREAIT